MLLVSKGNCSLQRCRAPGPLKGDLPQLGQMGGVGGAGAEPGARPGGKFLPLS